MRPSADGVYAQIMRELRMRDPLSGRTEADVALWKADKAWQESKRALAQVAQSKEK